MTDVPTVIVAVVSVAGLGGSVLALAYAAGQLAQRVASLEEWRHELNTQLGNIHTAIRNLDHLIRNGGDG